MTDWAALSGRLRAALDSANEPVAIAFDPPERPAGEAPAPAAAGCVFWRPAEESAFTTTPADHANCSVGSYTHGLIGLEQAASAEDVAALLASDWVTPADLEGAPKLSSRPEAIAYGPLADVGYDPDVVVLRLWPAQAMVLSDALPEMKLEGKPQCQIVPLAQERNEVTASLGCAVSRVRTGMDAEEMTCAIPAGRLGEVVDSLERAARADRTVAEFAAADAERLAASS